MAKLTLVGGSTTLDVTSCKKIFVFNSFSLGIPKLTISNYKTIYSKVRDSGKYLYIDKTDESYFLFNYANGVIEGFNNIILLDDNNIPIGIYVYPNIQGKSASYNIYIKASDSKLESSYPFSGIVKNSLNEYLKIPLDDKFLGNDPKDYSSQTLINSVLDKPTKVYTPSIIDASLNNKLIFLGKNSLYKDDLLKLNIKSNLNIDTHNCKYTNFSLGYYMGDIVLHEWKNIDFEDYEGQYFNIISLTKTNNFGDPISYVKRVDDGLVNGIYSGGDYTRQYSPEIKKSKILYFSGKYIASKLEDESIRLYNLEGSKLTIPSGEGYWNNTWGEEDLENIFLDDKSKFPEIYRIGKFMTYENAVLNCPDLVNNYTSLSKVLEQSTTSLDIIRKSGNWFLFRFKKSNKSIYLLSGIYGNLYLSEDDLDRLMIINDNSILLKEDSYYVLYNCIKSEYYTERARSIIIGGVLDKEDILGTHIVFSKGDKESDEIYKGYYKEGIIEIIPNNKPLYKTSLNKFRRNSYPLDIEGIPNIIGTLDGLIFYIRNNKYINYL